MRAFIFGAGASKGYQGSKSGTEMPLARDFFKTFYKLDIAADPDVLVGHIVDYVRATRGVEPKDLETWNEDVEQFLTEVQNKLLSLTQSSGEAERIHLARTFDETVFLFASVINEIQNGPVDENYARLVNGLSDGDELITFNWDTLLDHALAESGKWNPGTGYGLTFAQVYDDGWVAPESGPSRVAYWKLHGSTNWLMPYYTLDLEKLRMAFQNTTISNQTCPLFCFVKADKQFRTYGGRNHSGYEPFSYFYYPPDIPIPKSEARPGYVRLRLGKDGSISFDPPASESMPFIIPPVQHKDYDLVGGALHPIWQGAEDAIANCDELHIVGYSFPVTDVRAVELLQAAVSRRDTPLRIVIANPYPAGIADRLRKQCGAKVDVEVREEFFNQYLEALSRGDI